MIVLVIVWLLLAGLGTLFIEVSGEGAEILFCLKN